MLIIIDHYLPSSKAGGPLKSVPNIVSQLKPVEFLIITRDRDLGVNKQLEDIQIDTWTNAFGAEIIYCSPRNFSIFGLLKIMRSCSFDVIYLNSLFA